MAKPYFSIRDTKTGLFFSHLSTKRLSEHDILFSGRILCMGKYAKVREKTIDHFKKLLRKIFGEMNPPPEVFQQKHKFKVHSNRLYRKWANHVEPLEIAMFPSSFEVVFIVPRSAQTKRSVTTVDFSLKEFAKQTAIRKNRMIDHGPAFFTLYDKVMEQGRKEFTHALIISGDSFRADTKNINEAMRTFARRADTMRVTSDSYTAIAFKNENDAVAFRLGYPGNFRVKMVVIQ